MKLANQSIKYLSISILVIISVWAVVFYFKLLDEIKESVDEELENYKRQLVYRAQTDSSILAKRHFDEAFFIIQPISRLSALSVKDRYVDTAVYMQDNDDEAPEPEPMRMLKTAFENKGNYYELTIINSMVEEDDLIEELLWDSIWLYFLLIVSIIVVHNLALRRLWKPFYSLLEQLKNYRLGRNRGLLEVKTSTKEFTDLQVAINTSLAHNIETYEQQKQFIGNASHELQTPLAIVINKLELLIENGGLDHSQAESIAEVMDITERLVRLNKSLLLLTKIENKQILDNKTVSLNKMVARNIRDLEEMVDYRNVRVVLSETAELTVQMDVSLAEILVSNLLRNAIFHNVAGGIVRVNVSANKVRISNTGINVPLDPDKIFTRFYKPEGVLSGTGLGLAIVKAICGLYGLVVSYRFENNCHCFELRLAV